MYRKIIGVAFVMLMAAAPAAMAQEYPAGDDAITSPTGNIYDPGDPATFVARTFQPGSQVSFTFFSDPVHLGTVTADANGVATINTRIPASADPGRHTVRASGIDPNGRLQNLDFSLTVRGGPGRAPLPRTGSSNSIDLTRVGVAALAGGGLLILASKKRRDRMAAATGTDR